MQKEVPRDSNGVLRCSINGLVKSVSFRPPKKSVPDKKIKSVILTGFKSSELREIIGTFSHLSSLRASVIADCERALEAAEAANRKIDALGQARAEIASEISDHEKTKKVLDSEIGRRIAEREGLIADFKQRTETIAGLKAQEEEIKGRIAERNAEREALSAEIAQKKEELGSGLITKT